MIEIDIKKRLGDNNFHYKFEIDSKKIVGIFGTSGAGKSTLINMIAGLIKPDSGKIVIDGRVLFDSEKNINIRTYKRNLGLIFQDSKLLPHLKIMDNIMYGANNKSDKPEVVTFEELIKILGISHLLLRYPRNLSGGEKQRVAIARAIISKPHIILMDEPNASLDDSKKDELLTLYSTLSYSLQIPFLYVTHSKFELRKIAQSVVIIDKFKVDKIVNTSELVKVKTQNRW